MRRFAWMILVTSLLVVCSCNQQDSDNPSTEAADLSADEYTPIAGSNIAIEGDTPVKVISVGEFDTGIKTLPSLVAIEGRVSESVAKMSTFILVDCSNKPGCESTCCSQATVPIRLTAGNYTGELPQVGESVIVIADLTVTETGYQLDVFEARRGSKTLLKTAREM